MQDSKLILVPAKLNIFLKILGKRDDGFHEIRSGITFINLYDHIKVTKNNKNIISYSGDFKPENGKYDNCIIIKTLNFLEIKKNTKLKIEIIKNIPVQGGLGSASANAAALIIALEDMNLIDIKKPAFYTSLGADIPCFLFRKDCLVTGMGEKFKHLAFPKYFFLLVKPKYNNSTINMYKKLNLINDISEQILLFENKEINEEDVGNDFEKIATKENVEFIKIFKYLENLDESIFTRMTGSGSCCYVAFEKKDHATKGLKHFKSKFPKLWSIVCENNYINN